MVKISPKSNNNPDMLIQALHQFLSVKKNQFVNNNNKEVTQIILQSLSVMINQKPHLNKETITQTLLQSLLEITKNHLSKETKTITQVPLHSLSVEDIPKINQQFNRPVYQICSKKNKRILTTELQEVNQTQDAVVLPVVLQTIFKAQVKMRTLASKSTTLPVAEVKSNSD